MTETTSAASDTWDNVLSRFERMLEETLAATFVRLAAFDVHANREEVGKPGEEPMQRVEALADGLRQRVESAETSTTEADLALAGGTKLAMDYLDHLRVLRQKVARATGRAIG